MEIHYTAITLGKRDIGETDRLYTLYTREAGKVKVYARGVRKPGARLAASLEDLQLTSIIVMRGRGVGNIKSAIAEKSFLAPMKDDFHTMSGVLRTVHIFDRLVGMEERDEGLFDLLAQYLGSAHLSKSMRAGFLVKMLSHLGHTLEVRRCAVCEKKIGGDQKMVLDTDVGGVLCADHAPHARYPLSFSLNAAKFYHLAMHNKISSLAKVQIPDRDRYLLENVLKIQIDALL